MAWLLLICAGLVEIVMAIALKQAQGWTRPVPSVIGIAAALGSVFLLTGALKSLPVGTAYAIWTGIGALGVSALGILVFDDSAALSRLFCMALIFCGIVGLHLLDA